MNGKGECSKAVVLIVFMLVLSLGVAIAPVIPVEAATTTAYFTINENPSPVFSTLIPDQAYVIKDNVNYKLYYAGNDFASINLAQSPDGITWTPYVHNPIISDAQYHSDVKYYSTGFPGANSGTNPSALTMNYRMWYQGLNQNSIGGWRYAESPDGINWYNHIPVTQFGPPVYSALTGVTYGIADVIYTPGASNTGTDWTFRIYANVQWEGGLYGGKELIVMAFSSNGYNWTGYDPTAAGYATPVFEGTLDPTRFDCDHIGWFKVIKNSPTDWEAFYSGGKDTTYQALNGIGYATSTDGIGWTRIQTLFTTSDGVAWRSQSVWMPSVVKTGRNYQIWFLGSDNSNIGNSDWIQWKVGMAILSSLTWTDHGKIFQPATGAYYPTVLYDANAFSGHGDNYYYKMWYSTGTGIALAYSNDGKGWAAYNNGQNLLALTNAHHNRVLYDAGGFGGSGVFYKIWYEDTSQLYSINAIRYAESTNGTTWVNDQPVTQDSNAKLVDSIGGSNTGDWNGGSYGPVWLFYNFGASNSGSNPHDYSYVMYYDATTGSVEQIGLSYSSDGKFWKLYGTGPVLTDGGVGSWDQNYVTHGSIVRYQGKYLLWYTGGIQQAYEGVGFAESSDGLVWTKGASNPIEVRGGTGSWNEQRDYTPTVIYDANKFSGHGDSSEFKMYYTGANSAGNKAIGYKTGPIFTSITVSYTVSGGGSPTAPTFSYTSDGPQTLTLSTSTTQVWADDGSAWSVSPNLGGSSGSEQWVTSTTSGGPLSSATTIAFSYQHQYFLTMAASPSSGGAVVPSSGWQNAGVTVPITGIASGANSFDGWVGSGSGSFTGTTDPVSITMNAAITETANFFAHQYSVSFTQRGAGVAPTVTYQIDSGTPVIHDLPWAVLVYGGQQISYTYESSVAGAAGVQYLLNGTSPASPQTVTGALTITGTYQTQRKVSFFQTGVGSDFTGTVATIAGNNYDQSALTAGVAVWVNDGGNVAFSFASPFSPVAGKLYVWTGTTGLSTLRTGTITVSASGTVIGAYETQAGQCILDSPRNANACGQVSAGTFSGLTAVAVNSTSIPPPAAAGTFPDGLFSFTVSGLSPGQTVTVTTTLSSPLPAGTFSYWKFHGGTWTQLPASKATLDSTRTVITLTLTDGASPDDSDLLANGVIVDPGGPAVVSPATTTTQTTTTQTTTTYLTTTLATLTSNTATGPSPLMYITVETDPSALGNPQGGGTYPAGSVIPISIDNVPGYTFVNWQMDGVDYTPQQSFTYTVDASHVFTAIFQATSTAATTTSTNIITQVVSLSTNPSPKCIIATAAYGSEMAPDVVYMRYVRDQLIGSTPTGKVLRDDWNAFYYSWSPPVAQAIAGNAYLQAIFRVLLLPLVGIIHATAWVFITLGAGDSASILAFTVAAALSLATYVAAPTFTVWEIHKTNRRKKLHAAA